MVDSKSSEVYSSCGFDSHLRHYDKKGLATNIASPFCFNWEPFDTKFSNPGFGVGSIHFFSLHNRVGFQPGLACLDGCTHHEFSVDVAIFPVVANLGELPEPNSINTVCGRTR